MISYSKQLAITAEADVVVAGAGPAGIAAAICVARQGMRTLVFDQHGSVGGMATNGLVGPFMTSFDIPGEKQIILGVFEEMVQRMMEMGGAIHPRDIGPGTSYSGYYSVGHNHVGPFDHEAFKLVATRMLLESGVKLLLHTTFTDVLMDGNEIAGLVVSNKACLSVIRAKQYIDCTGDADVAAAAKAPYWMGNGGGDIQPATLFFRVCNVDTEKLDAYTGRGHRRRAGNSDGNGPCIHRCADASQFAAPTGCVPWGPTGLMRAAELFRGNALKMGALPLRTLTDPANAKIPAKEERSRGFLPAASAATANCGDLHSDKLPYSLTRCMSMSAITSIS